MARPIALIDIREGAELLVLGGIPRSGKTLFTGQLYEKHHVPGLCMDAIVLTYTLIAPEEGVNWVETPERANKILRASQAVALSSLRTFGRYFLEGECMTPQVADALRQNFQIKACFLTMNNPRIEDIIRYEWGDDSWVRDLDRAQHPHLVAQLAERSAWLEQQAAQYGFPAVDVSAGRYEDRLAEVSTALMGTATSSL